MGRAGGFAGLLLVVCAGCLGSDGGPEAGRGTTARSQPPATQPATTTPAEDLPSPEGWATPAEREWLAAFGQWAVELARAREAVLAGGIMLDGATDEAAVDELERVLAPFQTCGEAFRRVVPDPPTARLREAETLVEAACGRYERGVAQLVEALRSGPAARAEREEAIRELTRAATSLALVNERVPPGERQRLPVLGRPARASHVNPRYGQAAGSLVNQRVEVRCWSRADWRRVLREATLAAGTRFAVADTGGLTTVGGARVNLAPFVCQLLDALVYRELRPVGRGRKAAMAVAVGILAHEAFHRSGEADEAAAECFGMQRIATLARELGVPAAYGRELGRSAWETYGALPARYRSPECRNGGELDLDPVVAGPWDAP